MAVIETQAPNVPAHIPPELIWEHDLDAFTHELGDPYLASGRLHEGPGIIWATNAFMGHPAWVLTRHALIEEAFIDYEHFSTGRSPSVERVLGESWRLIPLEIDPPEHHAYRQVLAPCFTPSAVRGLEKDIRELCKSLVSKFEDAGSCDFISEFAAIFPNSIFLSLMGMPQAMLPQLMEWATTRMRGDDLAKRAEATQTIMQYLRDFLKEQQVEPRTDLMKAIVSGRVGGRPLSDIEMLGICFVLYIGGLDTVYSSLGWIMRHLARDQALQNRLRSNPQEIPIAVEELTRAFGVAPARRSVVSDFTFHGVSMRKGDEVILLTYVASRDPQAFKNPHDIDIERRARHISFGTGVHSCLGIHLAKREIRIVIEEFLSHFKNIRLPQAESYEYHTSGVLGIDRLPLVLER